MADSPQTEEPQEDAETPEQPTTPADGTAPSDDVKDRFRAALERKRGEAKARSTQGYGGDSPKVHEARRAGGKRTFRRKSG